MKLSLKLVNENGDVLKTIKLPKRPLSSDDLEALSVEIATAERSHMAKNPGYFEVAM